jgi:nucleotide-binding universal stress UspA family protein
VLRLVSAPAELPQLRAYQASPDEIAAALRGIAPRSLDAARADLVVIGRHGHPSGPGPGIGSIQHAVLDHAHGPVAVVPSGA